MDSHVTTIVCPNCGANTTNSHNCEYCGSILVRYAAINKSVDKETFSQDAKLIPGLAEELKKNLSYQKIKKVDEVVVTNIICGDSFWQVMETAHCNFGTETSNPFASADNAPGIALRLSFHTREDDPSYAEEEKARLAWFKQTDYFFMFTQQNHAKGVNYYIDFGNDITGATQLISSFIYKEIDASAYFSFETRMVSNKNLKNIGGAVIDNSENKSRTFTIVGTVIVVILWIIYKLIF